MFKYSTHAISPSLGSFLADKRGATAIEYAIIASGISIVILSTVATLGSEVRGMFTSVSAALK